MGRDLLRTSSGPCGRPSILTGRGRPRLVASFSAGYRNGPSRSVPSSRCLNYYDAHHPYQLPPGRLHRFGMEPTDDYQRILIQQWGTIDKTTVSSAGVAFAVDAYDDCIADLDEQLGTLIDELDLDAACSVKHG